MKVDEASDLGTQGRRPARCGAKRPPARQKWESGIALNVQQALCIALHSHLAAQPGVSH